MTKHIKFKSTSHRNDGFTPAERRELNRANTPDEWRRAWTKAMAARAARTGYENPLTPTAKWSLGIAAAAAAAVGLYLLSKPAAAAPPVTPPTPPPPTPVTLPTINLQSEDGASQSTVVGDIVPIMLPSPGATGIWQQTDTNQALLQLQTDPATQQSVLAAGGTLSYKVMASGGSDTITFTLWSTATNPATATTTNYSVTITS